MTRETVTATVDDREPAAVADAVRTHPDVERTEVRRLDAGDIVFGDVGVERKTPSDYASAVFRPTGPDLYDQVRRLAERFDHRYVLLEGNLDDFEDLRGAPSPAAIQGSVASITARYGAPVIPCADRERLVDVAVRLGRKHVEEPGTRPLSVGAIHGGTEPVTKRMYGCIEGVGPETATRLYRAFPTVEALVSASREELLRVDGIGEKRATAIYRSLRVGDSE